MWCNLVTQHPQFGRGDALILHRVDRQGSLVGKFFFSPAVGQDRHATPKSAMPAQRMILLMLCGSSWPGPSTEVESSSRLLIVPLFRDISIFESFS